MQLGPSSGVKVRYAVVVQIVELYFNFQCLLYQSYLPAYLFVVALVAVTSRLDLRPLLKEDSQVPDVGASDGRRPGANTMELINICL